MVKYEHSRIDTFLHELSRRSCRCPFLHAYVPVVLSALLTRGVYPSLSPGLVMTSSNGG